MRVVCCASIFGCIRISESKNAKGRRNFFSLLRLHAAIRRVKGPALLQKHAPSAVPTQMLSLSSSSVTWTVFFSLVVWYCVWVTGWLIGCLVTTVIALLSRNCTVPGRQWIPRWLQVLLFSLMSGALICTSFITFYVLFSVATKNSLVPSGGLDGFISVFLVLCIDGCGNYLNSQHFAATTRGGKQRKARVDEAALLPLAQPCGEDRSDGLDDMSV